MVGSWLLIIFRMVKPSEMPRTSSALPILESSDPSDGICAAYSSDKNGVPQTCIGWWRVCWSPVERKMIIVPSSKIE